MQHAFEAKDDSKRLIEQVKCAYVTRSPVRIAGGNSKSFLGRPVQGEELDTRSHRGIVSYDPTELVITVRAGTPLVVLSETLREAGQMLPCEPPEFQDRATVGGAVASGLCGPRRPWAGSMRDFVLGCRVISGQAQHLRFGGEVMKNVAGYDMSRLLAGSFGCLGILTEVSLKVLPGSREQRSVTFNISWAEASLCLSEWRKDSLPISGACYVDGKLHIRLEGGAGSVQAALGRIGGEELDPVFWSMLREQQLPFFKDPRPLWRLSTARNRLADPLPGEVLLDWGGSQLWLKSDETAKAIRDIAEAAGGHATCFTARDGIEPFHPLEIPVLRYQRKLKERLDPRSILNPGRMYADF
ncbi:glycolate oxidase FAD binding subunit [Caballeronia udeis]|uniref:Glycolate oxidase FAD binding subunit n=1 Tax=Caballeronia udeis TaxID=1232866 RepID=A0ABW8N339_9BURK